MTGLRCPQPPGPHSPAGDGWQVDGGGGIPPAVRRLHHTLQNGPPPPHHSSHVQDGRVDHQQRVQPFLQPPGLRGAAGRTHLLPGLPWLPWQLPSLLHLCLAPQLYTWLPSRADSPHLLPGQVCSNVGPPTHPLSPVPVLGMVIVSL